MDFLFSLPLYLLENIKDFHQKKRLFFLKQNIIYDKTVIKPYTFYAMITIRYNSFFSHNTAVFPIFQQDFSYKIPPVFLPKTQGIYNEKTPILRLKKVLSSPQNTSFPYWKPELQRHFSYCANCTIGNFGSKRATARISFHAAAFYSESIIKLKG